jgi:hypothetical protein
VTRRETLALFGAVLAIQVFSTVAILIPIERTTDGFRNFTSYFGIGDWIAIRVPVLAAALCGVLIARRQRSIVAIIADTLGILTATLFIGLVLWMLAIRANASEHYFPHYLEWPVPDVVFWVMNALVFAFGCFLIAFGASAIPRAFFFALGGGLLILAAFASAAGYDVVGVTVGWAGLAGLGAALLTPLSVSDHKRAALGVVAGLALDVILFLMVFWMRLGTIVFAIGWLIEIAIVLYAAAVPRSREPRMATA